MNENLMPVIFVGHGSPMNAIEKNAHTQSWRKIFNDIRKPDVVLLVSAHYITNGIYVTTGNVHETIHDFYGFPPELYKVRYPARCSPELVERILELGNGFQILPDSNWGLDHGAWSVLIHMIPDASIPVVQLSLNSNFSVREHFEFSKILRSLREKNILVMGSGNLVHNLGMLDFSKINRQYGYDWAESFNNILKMKIASLDYESLINYTEFGKSARLSIPTSEHYLPALYILGASYDGGNVEFFNDDLVGGSISMTSFIIK